MLAKVRAKAAKPTVGDLKAKGEAIADAAEIAALKAKLEAAGFSVREKKDRQNVIPELLAELKAIVEKHGGVDAANVKQTFVRARKELWKISPEQRQYNRQQAQKRKAKAEAEELQ